MPAEYPKSEEIRRVVIPAPRVDLYGRGETVVYIPQKADQNIKATNHTLSDGTVITYHGYDYDDVPNISHTLQGRIRLE